MTAATMPSTKLAARPKPTAVKLMWVLGQTTDRAEAEKLFLTPVQWDIL